MPRYRASSLLLLKQHTLKHYLPFAQLLAYIDTYIMPQPLRIKVQSDGPFTFSLFATSRIYIQEDISEEMKEACGFLSMRWQKFVKHHRTILCLFAHRAKIAQRSFGYIIIYTLQSKIHLARAKTGSCVCLCWIQIKLDTLDQQLIYLHTLCELLMLWPSHI